MEPDSPKVRDSVATEHAIAGVPDTDVVAPRAGDKVIDAEAPRCDVPHPAAGVPEHVHDAVCDIKDVPVGVAEEVALFAVRLLLDHLVEICHEFRLALEHVVCGHDGIGLDLLVVCVL